MFFLLPVGVDYSARRYPVVTFTLLGVNAAFYVLSLLLGLGSNAEVDPLITAFGLIPAEKHWWTWITYSFVHGGLFHFAGNMVYLYLFGACVEDLLGRLPFIVFYLAGGLLADLAQVVFTTDLASDIPIVGASGAITACLGAFVVALPRTRINFRYAGWLLRPFGGEFWVPSWIVVSLWFASDLLSLLGELSTNGSGEGVAFAAHLGGMIAGALFMWAVRRKLELLEPRPPSPRSAPAGPARSAYRVGASPAFAAESPSIYLNLQEPPAGPFTRSAVVEMMQVGSIPRDTYYWREGMAEWRTVLELSQGPR